MYLFVYIVHLYTVLACGIVVSRYYTDGERGKDAIENKAGRAGALEKGGVYVIQNKGGKNYGAGRAAKAATV